MNPGGLLLIFNWPELHPLKVKASDKTVEKVETIIRKLSTKAREHLFKAAALMTETVSW